MASSRHIKQRPDRVYSARRGFTLIELLVTVTIFGILLAVGLPSFTEFTLSSKLGATANELVVSARMARSEAIKRNANVIMCTSTNGTSCSTGNWENGWILLAGTTVLKTQTAVTGLRVTEASTLSSLTFQSSGIDSTQATFKICRSSPNAGRQERQVAFSATGRSTVTRTNTGICP